MMLWVFVLARIISNPISNVLQKLLAREGASPLFIILATYAILGGVCLPWLLVGREAPRPGFWVDITVSALLAVGSNATLVAALKRSDLSVLGPINSYKAVVSLLPGIVFLGEIPSVWQLGGITLIVAGSLMVLRTAGKGPRRSIREAMLDRGIQLRFAALLLSAVEAVFLKRALLASTVEMTFVLWSVFGLAWGCVVLPFVAGNAQVRAGVKLFQGNRRGYVLLALTTGIMQFSSLVTFQQMAVGPALALFQTSTLLTVVLGRTVFAEGHFVRRVIGSVVMMAGAVVIILER